MNRALPILILSLLIATPAIAYGYSVQAGISSSIYQGTATYDQALAYYEAGGQAWSQAWGASEVGKIRQHLITSKTAYTNCHAIATALDDPANGANIALLKAISTAYIDLADAALAMYDGADVYTAGRGQIAAGTFADAAASFQDADEKFTSSKTFFSRATTGLQSVSYAGTEFGDGTAYTSAIVPILNAKGMYMGEFAAYARGWQHTALAYGASASGDRTTFVREAAQALDAFDELRTSPSFGSDAANNYEILAALIPPGEIIPLKPTDDQTVTTTPTPTPTATPTPTTEPIDSSRIDVTTHFIPSGWMGDYPDITYIASDTSNPHSGSDSIKIVYSAAGSRGNGWGGIYWLYPENNWGSVNEGRDLSGCSRVTFWARGEQGGEKAEFKVGGVTGTYPDSLSLRSTGVVELSDRWKEFSINIDGADLSHVIGGFCWVTNEDENPTGCKIYLDDIYYS
ncbi:MAG: hypothetical protein GXY82_07795 [Methanospirillum sp.]|nr:hypothetical protein [Methanospirillum sp.]